MAISYIVNLDELSVLSYFCGVYSIPGLPELPRIESDKCEALIKTLGEQGMIYQQGDSVSVDMALGFAIVNISRPSLFIKMSESLFGYCTAELGVVVAKDVRSVNKYRLTPLQNASELAKKLWGESQQLHSIEIYLHYIDEAPKLMQMTNHELEAAIRKIYL